MGESSTAKSQISAMVVGAKYRLQHKLGSGSFGDIYQAVNINSGEVSVATYAYPTFFLLLINRRAICEKLQKANWFSN